VGKEEREKRKETSQFGDGGAPSDKTVPSKDLMYSSGLSGWLSVYKLEADLFGLG
jgi:hypothetical protein